MAWFGKKNKQSTQSVTEQAFQMANNVFKNTLFADEKVEHALQGKSAAEKLIFSVGIFAATKKRLLYYFQDGSQTKTETIMYDKIISITSTSGFEQKMGNYIGVEVELANGPKRVVRLVDNQNSRDAINEFIFYVEGMR